MDFNFLPDQCLITFHWTDNWLQPSTGVHVTLGRVDASPHPDACLWAWSCTTVLSGTYQATQIVRTIIWSSKTDVFVKLELQRFHNLVRSRSSKGYPSQSKLRMTLHIHIYIYTERHIDMYTYIHLHRYMNIHTYTYTDIHGHMYT